MSDADEPVREVTTASPDETEALGARLGRAARGGELLGLVGDLGAGKTCLVRGLAAGLGADPDVVHSPTFVIATEYRGGRLALHHVDLYRCEPPLVDTLFLREALYGDGRRSRRVVRASAADGGRRVPPRHAAHGRGRQPVDPPGGPRRATRGVAARRPRFVKAN